MKNKQEWQLEENIKQCENNIFFMKSLEIKKYKKSPVMGRDLLAQKKKPLFQGWFLCNQKTSELVSSLPCSWKPMFGPKADDQDCSCRIILPFDVPVQFIPFMWLWAQSYFGLVLAQIPCTGFRALQMCHKTHCSDPGAGCLTQGHVRDWPHYIPSLRQPSTVGL